LLLQLANDGNFDQNDTIAAFLQTSSNTTAPFASGFSLFSLPRADFTGSCNSNNLVRFESASAADAGTCVEHSPNVPDTFRARCEGAWSARALGSELRLARSAAAAAASLDYDNISVTVRGVTFVDFFTGKERSVNSSSRLAECATAFFASASAYSAGVAAAAKCSVLSHSLLSVSLSSSYTQLVCASGNGHLFASVSE